MTLRWTQIRSARFRSFVRQAFASPLRYGVVAVIVATLGYTSLRIVPMLHRDLQLLQEVYAVDEKGISLVSDLQSQIQESRRQFLRIQSTEVEPATVKDETRSMQEFDETIAQTESRIAPLEAIRGGSLKHFHESWLNYVALRDSVLLTELEGSREGMRKAGTEQVNAAFLQVDQAVRADEAAFETSSARRLGEVSGTLVGTLRELFVLMWIKIFVLSLLVWTDWKRLRAEKQLQKTTYDLQAVEDKLHLAYDSAEVGMGIIGLDGSILSVNRFAGKILGYQSGELIGRKVKELIAPEFQESHAQQLSSLANGETSNYRTERQYIAKDGTPVWIRNYVNLMKAAGEERQCFFTSEDITQQKKAYDRLAYLANFDPVTNLPNRRSFEEQLAEALRPAPGVSDCVALLYVEIDSFDFLKGTFGRTVADEVLNEAGCSLAAFQHEDEIVGRLDDHGFGMLVRAAPYDEATMTRAGELRDVFRRAVESGKHRIPLSASIGIAYSNDSLGKSSSLRLFGPGTGAGTGADTLIKFARAAMLEARSRGGDSIFVADPSLQERAAQRHEIESALLRGLRENEFRVAFQPQFEIATGKLVRFEALCRWTSAELGSIPPDRFIPIAEQTGLITEIGRRVMNEALLQAKSWTDTGRQIGVAINISPMQFMRPDFPHVIEEALTLSDFPPELLELEITEGIFIRDLNLAVARIRELQRLGLSVALDDFGTGYSSLSYLQRMPIDAVKLDRSFVSDLTTDVATVSMVRSVLAMAKALNLRVVTEGVETEQQLEILRALGCDEAQGYLLGRPESPELALQRVMNSPTVHIGILAQ
jgi:PAS domain S-box-containing protein/diguanylate cyclase (GGDEF)-like protein